MIYAKYHNKIKMIVVAISALLLCAWCVNLVYAVQLVQVLEVQTKGNAGFESFKIDNTTYLAA